MDPIMDMNLSNISTIRQLLDRHGFQFSKALGQNFLINPSVCPRMAEQSGADKSTGVLEIGPGIGVLTTELAKVAAKVVSVEVDSRLLPVLEETVGDLPNVSVVHGDILKLNLPMLLEQHFSGMDVVVCANLPYYITSPILMALLESRLPFRSVTVMVQKEAADRICAAPGTRASGAISAAVHYYAAPQILFQVSRGSFLPAPKVDSCVIRLDLHAAPPVPVTDERRFFALVKAAFGQRRKTVSNSISAGLGIPKAAVSSALEAMGLSPSVRAEQLTLDQLAALSQQLL